MLLRGRRADLDERMARHFFARTQARPGVARQGGALPPREGTPARAGLSVLWLQSTCYRDRGSRTTKDVPSFAEDVSVAHAWRIETHRHGGRDVRLELSQRIGGINLVECLFAQRAQIAEQRPSMSKIALFRRREKLWVSCRGEYAGVASTSFGAPPGKRSH